MDLRNSNAGTHLKTAGSALINWWRAATLDALIVGVLWLIGLELIRVPWAPFWAILGGLLQIIPTFGGMVALIGPVLAVAFSGHDEWRLGLFGGCSASMLRGLIHGAREDPAEAVMQQMTHSATPHWWHRQLAPDHWAGRALRSWLRTREIQPFLDLAESLVAADFRQSLQRMDAPLMIVLGEQSPHYRDVPLADWYRRTVPHCRISRYVRAGHSPHFTEPIRFARELLAFIDDHA